MDELVENIKLWTKELGFSDFGISDIDLKQHENSLQKWLKNNYHGSMSYMEKHGMMRARPAELEPGTLSVISVRMDYLPDNAKFASTLKNKNKAYISRYALGRDYHKLMRKKLKQLGDKISKYHAIKFRPFVDSAPILERPLAEKAGLGWIGKHSLLLNKEAGSWFFLGEIFIDLPLPRTAATNSQGNCGDCVACINICPTKAIIEPYVVDSRKCISYLTIETDDPIPVNLRSKMGNRIYGCDDCQLVCPWNRFAKITAENDFQARHQLNDISLKKLFAWSEKEFLEYTKGSAIRRIGYQRWQRNIAVAIGNAPYHLDNIELLESKIESSTAMVVEHILWAIKQQKSKKHTRK